MKYVFTNKDGLGEIKLWQDETFIFKNYYQQNHNYSFHTLLWNRGASRQIWIDEVAYTFESNTILPLMLNQSFHIEEASNMVAWQFNREFYCIANHDHEVSCVGFLFFGPSPTMFVSLDEENKVRMQNLLDQFIEEFNSEEEIKGEMLRILLVRLIIQVTRLAKKQHLVSSSIAEEKFNLFRQFNLLVEIHFRQEHRVSYYASLLNKSPKTISNYFLLYCKKSPQQVIKERLITEAKRILLYTEKSIKEVSYELGFEDASHFSTFFKKNTSISPTDIKKTMLKAN